MQDIDINKEPPSREFLEKHIDPERFLDFVSTRSPVFKERPLPKSKKEAIALMMDNPNLIRRPIMVKGSTVIFGFDKVPESALRARVRPGLDGRVPEQGVLATRSQLRPSPLGVSVVRLLRRRRNVLRVDGLDAIDGTPVLDIKPYFPNYDAVPDAGVPEWARALISQHQP